MAFFIKNGWGPLGIHHPSIMRKVRLSAPWRCHTAAMTLHRNPSTHLQVSTTHVTSPVQGRRSCFGYLFSISGLEVDGANVALKYRLIHRLSLNCRLWTSFQTVRHYKPPVIFSPSAVRSRDFSECNGSVSQQTRCLRRGKRQTAANRCVIGRGRRGRRQSAWRRGRSPVAPVSLTQSAWHRATCHLISCLSVFQAAAPVCLMSLDSRTHHCSVCATFRPSIN